MKFDATLMKIVKKNLDANVVPMLLGEPGIGKSSWVEGLASEMGTRCFTLPCNQLADKADLTGARLVPSKGQSNGYEQVFYPHMTIKRAIDYAKEHKDETPILFLDEINRTTHDVTSELLSIPTMREIGDSRLPDNLKVITAGNDKGNVTAIDTASISRFVLYRVEPDIDTFKEINTHLNKYIRECIRHSASLFEHGMPIDRSNTGNDIYDAIMESNSMSQITTPRTIIALNTFMNASSDDDLKEYMDMPCDLGNVLTEIIYGYTGNTKFSNDLISHITSEFSDVPSKNTMTSALLDKIQENENNSETDQNALSKNQIASASDEDLGSMFVTALKSENNEGDIIKEIDQEVKKRNIRFDKNTYRAVSILNDSGSINIVNARYCTNAQSKELTNMKLIISGI